MSDEPIVPPFWESQDGYDEDMTIERDLRAAFAPVPAPHDFRERLKADLLRGDERLVLLSAPGAPRQRFSQRMIRVVDAVATHPRALAAATLAAAAAILLALALNANNFGGRDYNAEGFLKPTPAPSLQPTRTLAATATPPHPTVTATARVTPTATAQPVLAPPRPTTTQEPVPATPTPAAPTAPPQVVAPTTHPQPTATSVMNTNQPAPRATPAPDSGQTATPSPVPATATVVAPPSATATLKPMPTVVVPHAITPATAAPTRTQPAATPTPVPPTATGIPTPRAPLLSPTSVHKGRTPAATVRVHMKRAPTATPTDTPAPSSTATPMRRPTKTPIVHVHMAVTVTPRPTATPRPTKTVAPTATPRPTVTPRPTATATATVTVAPTATASATPVPTAVAHNVLGPASRPSFLLPSADNTALNSPLQGALTTDAIQGISFTAPQTWTPPQLTSPYLPVYPIMRVPVTTTDVLTVTRELGARDARDITMQEDGGIAAHVQVDGAPYTLTVYAGYGTPRFTLHALASEPGTLSSVRLAAQASAWLQYHGNLSHPDMRALPPSDGVMTYNQTVSDTEILGPVALSLSFDGRGALRDLSYNYVVPSAPILAPAQSSIIAANTAILTYDGQALYVGPQPPNATGSAMVSGLTLAYVGVRDVKNDYLEPVYVLNGAVGGASGPQPFDLYISALAPPPVPTSTTGP